MGQRSLEKCKSWYVIINKNRNTCCCRYHIEYTYYYDTYIHILCFLHNTLVQECSTTLPPTSSREFIHSILCRRTEGCTFYQRPCVDGTCPRCGGMAFLDKCIHVTDEHELGRNEVNLQSFKYVTYDISGGNERRKIQLVTSQVSNEFMNSIFSYWYLFLLHICNNLLICTSLLLIYQVPVLSHELVSFNF